MYFALTSAVSVVVLANIFVSQGFAAENSQQVIPTARPSSIGPTKQPRPRKSPLPTAHPTTANPSNAPVSTSKPTHRRRPGQPSRAPVVIITAEPSTLTPEILVPTSTPSATPTKISAPVPTSKPTHRRRPGQPTRAPTAKTASPISPTSRPVTPTPRPIAPLRPTSKPVSSGPSTCNICGPGLVVGNPGGILTMMGNCSQYQNLGNQGGIPPKLCTGFPALAAIPCNCTVAPS